MNSSEMADTIMALSKEFNKKEENENTVPFGECLDNTKDKFVAIISRYQYATKVGGIMHEDMTKKLIESVRPDLKMDSWGNVLDPNQKYTNDSIVIYGQPGYISIELPEKELLSGGQFECLKEVLLAIKDKNNQDYGYKYETVVYGNGIIDIPGEDYGKRIDDLINKLRHYVTNDIKITHEPEVIIGKKLPTRIITEEEIDNIIEDMANNPITDKKMENISLKGYSNIFLIGITTIIISIGILVLGIIINTL